MASFLNLSIHKEAENPDEGYLYLPVMTERLSGPDTRDMRKTSSSDLVRSWVIAGPFRARYTTEYQIME